MKREIKFRAWDKNVSRVFDVQSMDWKNKVCWVIKPQGHSIIDPILMQYTGLKDKNGKEIYEGDVVKTMMHYADDDGNPVNGQETTFEVKWVENNGSQYVGLSLFPCDDIHQLEIIGNIYENKDLLV